MVIKREVEQAIVNESVMRMAKKIRDSAVLDEGNLPLCMPDFVKDALSQAVPVALAIIRLSELSKWN